MRTKLAIEGNPKAGYSEYYDSWEDFLSRADAPRIPGRSGNASRRSKAIGWASSSEAWYASKDFEEALSLARDGWKEGEDLIKPLSMEAKQLISDKIERPFYVYDVEGTEVDVARFLDGEPEHWTRQEYRVTDGPGRRIMKVAYNITASFNVDAEVLTGRGAAVLALVELLELGGYGVELVVGVGVNYGPLDEDCNYSSLYGAYVPIKGADQPLDLPRAAFAIAHPSMFRRMFFSVMELWPEPVWKAIEWGYGSAAEFPKAERGDIYIGCAQGNDKQWREPKLARDWILKKLSEAGVKLNTEEGAIKL